MIYLNVATGFNLPPFWLNRPVHVLDPQTADSTELSEYLGNLYQCPLEIKWENESEWWRLPFDPVISISGKNIIVRRNVLKQPLGTGTRRGTVKEAWSQDDYEVNIAGVFMGKDNELPENDLRKFRQYCEERKLIEVKNDLFTLFNIGFLAIESFDLPFTKGVENQMYTIRAFSDDNFELLVHEKR